MTNIERLNYLEKILTRAMIRIGRLEKSNSKIMKLIRGADAQRCKEVETDDENDEPSGKKIKCRKNLKCFRCNGMGHFASECAGVSNEVYKMEVNCYTCGGIGHTRKFGPKCFGCGGIGHNYSLCRKRNWEQQIMEPDSGYECREDTINCTELM